MIRFLTAGESHGKALTIIVDGFPSNLKIAKDYINSHLKRRQVGYGRGLRMKIESDAVEILLFLIIMLAVLQIKIKAQENSWYQTNGPYGGDVGSIVIDSTGNLFAGTTEGVYRSTDKGNHWVQFGFKDTNVTGLIINKKGQIFACYGLVSATVPVYPCHGIYRSNDGGISWQLKISGFYSPTPAISFAMTKDGILYAGTIGSGVFRSTNDGDTWTHLSFGDTTGEAACLAF